MILIYILLLLGEFFQRSYSLAINLQSSVTKPIITSPAIIESDRNYIIRDAKLADLPHIRKCKERNLPEVYDGDFYFDQLAFWPNLSLVVCNQAPGETIGIIKNIVGYVLVRTTDFLQEYDGMYPDRRAVITSITVDQAHRGRGLARDLLNAIHEKILLHYPDIKIAQLNCRVSHGY